MSKIKQVIHRVKHDRDKWLYAIAYMSLLFLFSYATIMNAVLHECISVKNEYFSNQSLWFSSIVNFGLLFMLMLDFYGTNKRIESKKFTIGSAVGCFLIITLRELVHLHTTREYINYISPLNQEWFVYFIHFLFFCCLVFLKKETITENKERFSVVRV